MGTLSKQRFKSPFEPLERLIRRESQTSSLDTSAEIYVQLRAEYRTLLASVTPDLVLIGRVRDQLSVIEDQMRSDRRRRQQGSGH